LDGIIREAKPQQIEGKLTLTQIVAALGGNAEKAGRALQISPSTMRNWFRRNNGVAPKYWHAHIIREAKKHGLEIDVVN
jgi:methylphosphotriester-DNA--protein-cysteine methyltransferase